MRIPKEIIEKIRIEADIVEIIGEYVNLKRRGSNFLGLCPFHNEKTPSFTVSHDKGIYKCFGCQKSGNVFTFLQEYHSITYVESVEQLANKLNIHIPKEHQQDFQEQSKTELALKSLKISGDIYYKNLHSVEGKTAMRYFIGRGIRQETIDKFQLGYSSDSWTDVMNILQNEGIKEENMLDSGLIIKNDNGRIYDRFRGRVMFPIKDFLGRIIGFGARQLIDDKEQPKYINSPQSLVYDKSKVLFGLFDAKNSIRAKNHAIVVEGYLDVLQMHQYGFENAVAPCGTSLTGTHLDLLSRYTKKVILLFDADNAGRNATEKSIEAALYKGFEVSICELPQGEDPDSFLRDNGTAQFQTALENSLDFTEYLFSIYKQEGKINSPADKTYSLRKILRLISLIPDPLQHDFYISNVAKLFEMSEYQLQKIYNEKSKIEIKVIKEKEREYEYDNQKNEVADLQLSDVIDQLKADTKPKEFLKKIMPEESYLIKLSLKGLDNLSTLIDKYEVSSEIFINEEAKQLFDVILNFCENEDILNDIMDSEELPSYLKEVIGELAIDELKESDIWYQRFENTKPIVDEDKMISEVINRLNYTTICNKVNELKTLIGYEQSNMNLLIELNELMKEKNRLSKFINNI